MFSYYQIYKLFKSAAEDIATFYPEWVRKHPELKKFKLLTDIKKEIPVEDYREKLEGDTSSIFAINDTKRNMLDQFIIEFITLINNSLDVINNVSNIVRRRSLELMSSTVEEDDIDNFFQEPLPAGLATSDDFNQIESILESFYRCLQEIDNAVRADYILDERLPSLSEKDANKFTKYMVTCRPVKVLIGKNVFFAPQDTYIGSVLAAYSKKLNSLLKDFILTEYGRGLHSLLSLSEDMANLAHARQLQFLASDEFKTYLQRKMSGTNFQIVFSKQPSDLLSMSIRSFWTSCQNLLKEETAHNVKSIYSAISPYVGIIYLTDSSDFKSRGEEMIGRSLVFYVEHKDTHEPALTISATYSNFDSSKINNLFEESLQKKSTIKVIPYSEAKKNYYFPTQSEDKEKNPYFDSPLTLSPPRKKLQP